MSESLDFTLQSGVQRGDSAFLVNSGRHRLAFDAFPGRMIALAFLGRVADPAAQSALTALSAKRPLVDEGRAACFAVLSESEAESGLKIRFPSIVFLSDGDETARGFGADRCLVILDPALRVIDVAPLDEIGRALAHLDHSPPPGGALEPSPPAPILVLPHVFEPELCTHLIACFEGGGGAESGFMQDQGARAIENFDRNWKRRSDFHLTDPRLIANLRARVGRRICPEIRKAFQMRLTRIERDLVARYDSETGGHFGPHRDDTGISVAHRRFAVSINLNADFDGGEIAFPEYAPRSFKAAPGAAVVFSASILHQVSRVTRGQRYVFLTFLFDEEAERVRQANLRAMQEAQRQPQLAASA
ncbi:MAG TPA: 2OG-Fe(II) oxygenase [Roseiarcus sp.]|jgi:predicted 2-oxoglutarate/Fe(II)-dependent dioxygenase YbiX